MNPTQGVESDLAHSGLEMTEVSQCESDTGEGSDTKLTEPEVEELEFDISQHESPLVVPTLDPPSPRRKLIIMTGLPLSLISIEDITRNEEEESPRTPVITNETFYPRVPFDPFRLDPWYCTPLNFLGPSFPPHCIPFYSPI